jgi:molecular chaperone GrpE
MTEEKKSATEDSKDGSASGGEEKKDTEHDELKKKAEEYLAGWQRAKADYSNYKKQVAKEKEELAQFATIAMVLDFLPLHANFKRAFSHVPEAELKKDWVIGIQAIKKQLDDMLNNMNIKEIEAGTFDPTKHEAIERRESADHKPGEIIEIAEPGYQMLDKVIQPAKVIVATEDKSDNHPKPVEGSEEKKITKGGEK